MFLITLKWLKEKKCVVNQKYNDNKCFQYAASLALNFNNIDRNLIEKNRYSKNIKN